MRIMIKIDSFSCCLFPIYFILTKIMSNENSIFEKIDFHPLVADWFRGAFHKASPPQTQGWPSIAAGKHTLILAPTGSGKTLAAFMWSIDQLFRIGKDLRDKAFSDNPHGVFTLYISPLKALNNDIERNLRFPLQGIKKLCTDRGEHYPDIRVAVRSGDTPSHVRQSMLRRPPHILITTPESLYLLLTSAKGRLLFRNLRYVIIDEIHALTGSKRGVHLSLSLERLMPLCEAEPVRIGLSATQKPLNRIAAFLGGQKRQPNNNTFKSREVNIIDCGRRKDIDLKILAPAESFSDLVDASIWPAVYEKLYELIQAHHTTLIFANMRAQTEKIARHLNELHRERSGDPGAQIALAHHGSISREERYKVEERLKLGDIPAVVATASLELGIDIGSIDLVVQLEAPKSVAGALQRVGRSGHLLTATSKGRLIPLYPSDLDDILALTGAMLDGDIEETVIPENALDVLAQHIVAEVALQSYDVEKLYNLVRGSYCYRNCSRALFEQVLEMLSGRYADNPLRYLQARLNWDKINNQLIARRGSRMLAAINGGAIPDRGYFSVRLKDGNIRLGEVEEEFVYESRVGEHFFLGNSEWRVDEIGQDSIIVTPVAAIKPKEPFWKGDVLYRDLSTSEKVGAFRADLIEHIEAGDAGEWLMTHFNCDQPIAENTVAYFLRQQETGQELATGQRLVGEWTVNSGGEPLFILHAPFGARVNGLWAIAISAALEKKHKVQVQYSFDDDGVLIRLLEAVEPPPMDRILKMTPQQAEALIIEALPETPIFAIHFRYSAARALLLPRSQPQKRIPLWLQRLRAADLLQSVKQYDDFPIILETYRDCLNDLFDLTGLKRIIRELNQTERNVVFVDSGYPSPMASGMIFKFIAGAMYDYDHSRQTGVGATVSHQYLTEILDSDAIPAIVTSDIARNLEMKWQHLQQEYKAKNAEDLFSIIEKLGPLGDEALAERSQSDPGERIDALQAEERIILLSAPFGGWIVREQLRYFSEPDNPDYIVKRLQRFLQSRGPVSAAQIMSALNMDSDQMQAALQQLKNEKQIVRGRLLADVGETLICDRFNFTELYRIAVGRRRQTGKPLNRDIFYRFLFAWQGIGRQDNPLTDVLSRYQGCRFPLFFIERELLANRLALHDAQSISSGMEWMQQLISEGAFFLISERSSAAHLRYLQLIRHGGGNLFIDKESLDQKSESLDPDSRTVFEFLRGNGASLIRDIEAGSAVSGMRLQQSLKNLLETGLVNCDNYQAMITILSEQNKSLFNPGAQTGGLAGTGYGRRRRMPRSQIQQKVHSYARLREGRWFLTSTFAVMGRKLSPEEKVARQAGILLNRYGVLVKSWYRHEQGLASWYDIFQVLKRMEWRGEVRRGYFIEGLSGLQFALPEALDLLLDVAADENKANNQPLMLSTIDPALPFGGAVPWNLYDVRNQPVDVTRSAANHLIFIDETPVFYCENYGARLTALTKIEDHHLMAVIDLLKNWLRLPETLRPRKRLEIESIDGQAASEHPWHKDFVKGGFEQDRKKLVLWPSAV